VELAATSGAFGPRQLRAALDSSPLWGAGRVEDKLGHDILATGGDGRRPDWLEAQTTCAAGRTRLGGSLGLHSDVA